MPDRKLILVPLMLMTLANSSGDISLRQGDPLRVTQRGAVVKFDGRDRVIVRYKTSNLVLAAKTPATLSISPDGQLVVHNFGSGSGQVYDLAAYRLRNGAKVDTSEFKRRVVRFARARSTCRIQPDQVSYLATGWSGSRVLKVKTEDWSRRPGCSRLNRAWSVRL